jgi:2-methylcitrate dehydratase PrpD
MDIEADRIATFIHGLTLHGMPGDVMRQAGMLLLDTLAVAASGTATPVSGIIRRHAVRHMGASEGGAGILFDGRRASAAGAAFANASTIDSFDAHDGHRLTKGHVGVTVVPSTLAFAEETQRLDGADLLAAVVGYEIGTRAGIALHDEAADYHTSGAWNALAAAAIGARYLRLDAGQTRHALGAAEYHGPRSQMMRCIDHPTMVKDGSGWGAFAGATAALLAADGFTGAPAVTVEGERHVALWADLGRRWRIMEQYVKPYPVCRWAQAPMEAVQAIMAKTPVATAEIALVTVRTFDAAVRLGSRRATNTEEAQYSTGFPLAALLVRGRVGAAEITDDGLSDPAIAAMQARIRVVEDEQATRDFPAARSAIVEMRLHDGRVLNSGRTWTRGDPDSPLEESAFQAKIEGLLEKLPPARRRALRAAVDGLADGPGAVAPLLAAVLPAP